MPEEMVYGNIFLPANPSPFHYCHSNSSPFSRLFGKSYIAPYLSHLSGAVSLFSIIMKHRWRNYKSLVSFWHFHLKKEKEKFRCSLQGQHEVWSHSPFSCQVSSHFESILEGRECLTVLCDIGCSISTAVPVCFRENKDATKFWFSQLPEALLWSI